MRDAVIVEAVRTPVGRRKGVLADVHPADLSAHVLNAVVNRAGVDPALVDDVIWGCVGQIGEQTYNVARTAVVAAGWPYAVPAVTIDRQCGSSQQAVSFAAAGVISGQYDVAVAGGVESMTRVGIGTSLAGANPFSDQFIERLGGVTPHQGIGAEMIAEKWDLSRAQLDEFALESHEKAARAQDSGAFKDEIEPIALTDGRVVSQDEGIRRGGSVESLGELAPVFQPDGGRITAANASQISDGAGALLVMTSQKAKELGLTPIVRVHTSVVTGDDPIMMLTGPIPATRMALKRAGLTMDDIGVAEVNEAFAPVPLAWAKEVGADPAILNPLGGAIALGHPLGATGSRLMTTMIHHMRANGIRYGLQTMCEGGGLANATILELL